MTFLSARWTHLAVLNYEVDADLLAPLIPRGTELDVLHGVTCVSLVGFEFFDTRVLGLPIPFHVNFLEANLRFYVKRRVGEELRRGVVFIKEIVPRAMVTLVANGLFKERYATHPMRHSVQEGEGRLAVRYEIEAGGAWQSFGLEADAAPRPMGEGSFDEQILEHYWGYAGHGPVTMEYQVGHPRWEVHPVRSHDVRVDFGALYGPEWASLNGASPHSASLAQGSPITVSFGHRLPVEGPA